MHVSTIDDLLLQQPQPLERSEPPVDSRALRDEYLRLFVLTYLGGFAFFFGLFG